MLVLKRHRGEVITIGEAHVQVLQISEDWVRFAIEAPPDWDVRWPGKPEPAQPTPSNALNSP